MFSGWDSARRGLMPMTKRAVLWSAVLILLLLLGAELGGFTWLALKEGRERVISCETRPKPCTKQ
jgi:hypothetical protein